MSRRPRKSTDSAMEHPLPREVFEQFAGESWRLTFDAAFRGTPHPDNDPAGEYRLNGQRGHVQAMLFALAARVAEYSVSVGLYPSIDAFAADMHAQASDPAAAGVAREGGAS